MINYHKCVSLLSDQLSMIGDPLALLNFFQPSYMSLSMIVIKKKEYMHIYMPEKRDRGEKCEG